jgi:hypothetical protein
VNANGRWSNGAPTGYQGHTWRHCTRHSKGNSLSRPAGANPPYFAANTDALTIPETNAHLTHPQNHCARRAQAQLGPARATPGFCPTALVCRLRQGSAIGSRRCAYSNRRRRRDVADRSLRRSTVHDMPRGTASARRAFVLVRAPHRSRKRVIAPMDYLGRSKGRGTHCLSGATTHQSGEGI